MSESTASETKSETKKEVTTKPSKFKDRGFHTRVGLAQFLLRELKEEEAQNLTGFGIQSQAITDFETVINNVIATDKKQEGTNYGAGQFQAIFIPGQTKTGRRK